MKKSLLVAVAALLTVSVSAVNRSHAPKAKMSKEMRAKSVIEKNVRFATIDDLRSVEAKPKAGNSVAQKTNKSVQAKAPRRAGVNLNQLIPTFEEYGWYWADLLGGSLQRNMYDGASFLVDGDKAYFAPFQDLDYVEGVLDPTANNPLAEYGAVVYKFTCDVIAGTKSGLNLSLEPCDFDESTRTLVRNGQETFNAYYFEENNELYCPEIIALFNADDPSDTEIFGETYVLMDLDILPQTEFYSYISKGTFSGKSLWDGTIMSGDCQIFLGYDSYYVKGANGCVGYLPDEAGENAWIQFAYDEFDPTIAYVEDYQYTGGPYQFNSGSVGYVVTVGAVHNGTEVTGFPDNDASIYKVTDNADGTTTIANTNNTAYGDYIINNLGFFETLDLSITITYDPVYTDIKGVKVEKAQNSDAVYNLSGQRVNDSFKGLVIKDGKKFIVK